MESVKKGEFNFEGSLFLAVNCELGEEWKEISKEAKDMITHMLIYDFMKRPSASELLKHKWLNEYKGKPICQKSSISVLRNLKAFKVKVVN
jgi:serine/threonine protein kinase